MIRCRPHIRFPSLLAGLALVSTQMLLGFDGMRDAPLSPSYVQAEPTVMEQAPILLVNYCAGCHQAGRSGIDLDGVVDRRALRRDRHIWDKVLAVLHAEYMPPTKAPQPSAADRQLLIRWIEEQFASLQSDRDCRLVVRRLSRQEYANAVRDLLGALWQAPGDFPADDTEWDLAPALPVLPASVQPHYEAAADRVLAAVDFDAQLATGDADPQQGAQAFLAAVARRAYRGQVPADETARLAAIIDNAAGAGRAPADGLRAALREVLLSPRFLFCIEQRADAESTSSSSTVSEYELAARLATFLWRSVPDEALLQLADQGRLRTQLAEETRRMLHDPRAAAPARDFAGAWLVLDQVDAGYQLPVELRRAMRQETESVVAYIIEQDRNVLELIDADYTFLNEALATHYGITGVRGTEMRRVSVAGTPRGGLVTQGSFLTQTGTVGYASPVQRGKWIMTNLLGTPPPPPPPEVLNGFFQPFKGSGPASLHKVLAQHRALSSCAQCHAQIDGLGLALADFDGTGTWRPQPEAEELAVLPDGETLHNVTELKSYLLERRELFLRALGGKLLYHALGRKLQERDRPAVEHVAARVLPEPRFGNLLREVIGSTSFQRRVWEP